MTARSVLAALAFGFLLAGTANAQSLLPSGFFERGPQPDGAPAAVEADMLSYDTNLDVISARGGVVMRYDGYELRADSVTFNQRTKDVTAQGNVTITDPEGDVFRMDRLDLTGGMKQAFIQSLTLTTEAGAVVTADDVHYGQTLETILTNASYSPCGLCVDAKGRKIGWRVKAARMIYNRDKALVTLEQPSLELLGIPVAWFPWLAVPDPTQPRANGFRLPSADYDAKTGVKLTVPYFVGIGQDTDLIFTPTLMSRQGFLMGAEWVQRFTGLGAIDIKASGVYQLDRGAFAGTVGDRDWRGAIQTSGEFTPVAQWTAGWSYLAFTDAAYLTDYNLTDENSSTNQVYLTHLSDNHAFDLRVQQFTRLGDYPLSDPDQQGITLPNALFYGVTDLGPGQGRFNYSAQLQNIIRRADLTGTYGPIPYVFGYAGNKAHLALEGAWEDQWILPGGLLASPYVGARLDAANYDGGSLDPSAPPASSLLSATPIAAMDFRWPLIATDGFDTHLLEPIAQLVYRGSSTTATGITNDNAQSFVFDDTNLFSYNRFSGSDRQETGLRANIGAHYQANFADGSWIDVVAGQSFHLAGVNGLGVPDAAQAGASTGLGGAASHIVVGAKGGFSNGLEIGGKAVIDPAGAHVVRAGAGLDYARDGYSAGLDYAFIAADPALGALSDQHEVTGRFGVPVYDYWTLKAGLTWDITSGSWIEATAGAHYDDGYLDYGLDTTFKPSSFAVMASFKLKGPDGELAF